MKFEIGDRVISNNGKLDTIILVTGEGNKSSTFEGIVEKSDLWPVGTKSTAWNKNAFKLIKKDENMKKFEQKKLDVLEKYVNGQLVIAVKNSEQIKDIDMLVKPPSIKLHRYLYERGNNLPYVRNGGRKLIEGGQVIYYSGEHGSVQHAVIKGYEIISFEEFREIFNPKKLRGYRIKKGFIGNKEIGIAAAKIEGYQSFGESVVYPESEELAIDLRLNTNPQLSIEKLKKAGVLDLWFEPVYEDELITSKIAYFADVEFVIKDSSGAETKFGFIDYDQLKYLLSVYDTKIEILGKADVYDVHFSEEIQIGCKTGTITEIRKIVELIESFNFKLK